jgi:Domain of unknown function (DUF4327)
MVHILHYSIDAIRDEARHLVEIGSLTRQQPIYSLCMFFSNRAWCEVERELEMNEFLMRDQLSDLFSQETWTDD